MKKKIACPECERGWCLACNNTGVVNGDPGMRKVVNECLTAFFSACCEDVKYTQSQEYFADFAENNEFEFYENGICIRHR